MTEETKKEETKTDPKEGTVVTSNDAKLKAAIACIPIVGLILFFLDKEDKRVRFYSAQGIWIGVAGIVLGFIPVVNFFSWILILVMILMTGMKAYQTEEYYKLPLLGDWAEQLAARDL